MRVYCTKNLSILFNRSATHPVYTAMRFWLLLYLIGGFNIQLLNYAWSSYYLGMRLQYKYFNMICIFILYSITVC